jgi:hypothetical protein
MDRVVSRNGVPIRLTEERVAGHRHLAVVYKELTADDGFVVTAYFTRRLARRTVVWRKQQQPGQ